MIYEPVKRMRRISPCRLSQLTNHSSAVKKFVQNPKQVHEPAHRLTLVGSHKFNWRPLDLSTSKRLSIYETV